MQQTDFINILKEANKENTDLLAQDIKNLDILKVLEEIVILKDNKIDKDETNKKVVKLCGEKVSNYVFNFLNLTFDKLVEQSDNKAAQNLTENDFAKVFVDFSKEVGSIVKKYIESDKNDDCMIALVDELYNGGLEEVVTQLLPALGIDVTEITTNGDTILSGAAIPMITYTAALQAYKIYNNALKDACIARERRIEIEKECNESIKMLQMYRNEIANTVDKYLYKYQTSFNIGITMINESFINGDVDSFISGNIGIQEVLKYDIQFKNKEEFEDLMNSDETFKL